MSYPDIFVRKTEGAAADKPLCRATLQQHTLLFYKSQDTLVVDVLASLYRWVPATAASSGRQGPGDLWGADRDGSSVKDVVNRGLEGREPSGFWPLDRRWASLEVALEQ